MNNPTPPVSTNETFPLTIEKLIYGGDGLARGENGEVFLTPGAVPGDQVIASRAPGQKKPARAHIRQIVQPSTDRETPPCEVFGRCGGCQWQYIKPEAQREWKSRIVEESLRRLGGFNDIAVHSAWGSDENSWRYRNRVQWDLTMTPDGPKLGYSQSRSHQVVHFADCLIIPEQMNALHGYLTRLFQKEPQRAQGLQRVEVFQNPAGDCLLSLHGRWSPALHTTATLLMREHAFLKGVVHFDTQKKNALPKTLVGESHLLYPIGKYGYRVSAGSFFQTHVRAAEYMLEEVFNWLPENTGSLLDLYAGVGTFAIALHEKAKHVTAIENAGTAIEDAKANKRRNQIHNLTLRAGHVDFVLDGLEAPFDAAILDPPRGGASAKAIQWLAQNITERILYISCNPTTLARDLKALSDLGWRIENVQPIDMFPQTYHVETMVQLIRC